MSFVGWVKRALNGNVSPPPQRAQPITRRPNVHGPHAKAPPHLTPPPYPNNNASSDSFSPRTRSNIASRSGTSMPRRSSPETSNTTCP